MTVGDVVTSFERFEGREGDRENRPNDGRQSAGPPRRSYFVHLSVLSIDEFDSIGDRSRFSHHLLAMGAAGSLQSRPYRHRENSSEPLKPFTVEHSTLPGYKFSPCWPFSGNRCLILPNPQAKMLAIRARVAISKQIRQRK
jgi:hypothetical protein